MEKEISSIVESIKEYSVSQGDKLCLVDYKQALTYEQSWNAIYHFSKVLQKYGIGFEDKVIVECTQDVVFAISGLSVQLLGGIFVPIEKTTDFTKLEEIISETNSTFFIGENDNGLFKQFIPMTIIKTSNINSSLEEDIWFPNLNQTAEILFTTGTTGKAKGIEITHESVIAVAENVIDGVEMKKKNIELIPMPLNHSHGLRRYYSNMLNGSTAVFSNGVIFVKELFNLIEQYNVTAIDLAPSLLEILFKLSKNTLSKYANQLDYIQLGSAPLKEEIKQRLCKLLPQTRLYNFYGTTEAGCACILNFKEESNRVGCIGKPTKNAEFKIVDENRHEIISSSVNLGFLACRGKMCMKGYWNHKELTDSVMNDGFIYSNDLGYIDNQGYLYMLGRKDDVINCGGVKIAPEEIEGIAMECIYVRDCACVPMEDKVLGQVPHLFVTIDNDNSDKIEEIKKYLSSKFQNNIVPKKISIIDKIPRTYNGKINRGLLKETIN